MAKKKKKQNTKPEQQPFRFLDLPAELRAQVYRYLLKGDCRINLLRWRLIRERPGRHFMIDGGCHPELSTAIVSANKQIYSEAMPILYSINSFNFGSPIEATDFIKRLGENAVHLRRIGFAHGYKKDIRVLLQALKPLSELSMLQMGSHTVEKDGRGYVYSPATLAKELGPLFKALKRHQHKKTDRKARDIPGIFSLDIDAIDDHDFLKEETRQRWKASAEACQQEVRDLLAEMLK